MSWKPEVDEIIRRKSLAQKMADTGVLHWGRATATC